MENTNDTSVDAAAQAPAADTQTDVEAQKTEATPRPKLSDEELLNVLEGRAQRLRTKLGKDVEAPKQSSPDTDLLQKVLLRTAGITDAEEQAEAIKTAKKWEMSVDQLVDDPDWQAKLERMRATKANEAATSDVKGSGNTQGAGQTVEHWLAKGVPPTAEQVPDRKVRAEIARGLMAAAKSTSKFYNG